MNLPVAITAILEQAFNRYIELDPEAKPRLQQLDGKVIAVELIGLNSKLFIRPTAEAVMIMSHYDGEVDTLLRGTPLSLLRMGLANNSEQQLFSGDVSIEGDTETGQRFQQILRQLDIDWEEHLSHITGDVIAYQVGRGLRGLANWAGQVQSSLLADTAEYLQEEQRLVASQFEVRHFNQAVDHLRNDVERIEARVKRLHQSAAS